MTPCDENGLKHQHISIQNTHVLVTNMLVFSTECLLTMSQLVIWNGNIFFFMHCTVDMCRIVLFTLPPGYFLHMRLLIVCKVL